MVENIKTGRLRARAAQALREYRKEVAHSRALQLLWLAIIFILTVLLAMIFSGDRFDPILRHLGLRGIAHEKAGLYADCSKPENQSNSYCYKGPEDKEQEWRKVRRKGSGAFSFNE